MDIEMIAMNIIANSGDARAFAFRALEEAKNENYKEAESLMEDSKKSALEAHKVQTQLLTSEISGESVDINILLIHSQDHLMNSILAQELIKELIILYKCKEDRGE